MSNSKKYHVALSYAGEQIKYVDQVANFLKSHNVRCFYDKAEEINLWGKNILEALQDVFEGRESHFVVIFISQEYVNKAFPRAEIQYALSPAVNQMHEYILPARFDDSSEVPGLPKLVKYISLKDKTPECFAEMVIKKMTAMGLYLGPDTSTGKSEVTIVPKADKSEATLAITIKDERGSPISQANIYLIHSNGTHRSCWSNESGEAIFSFDNISKNYYTIFIAHTCFSACIIENIQCDVDIEVKLQKKNSIGSIIFPNGTGYIPEVNGRLNPILDSNNRTYLYADNISINSNARQPAPFHFGENISLEDCSGKTADISIHRIIQQCIILDYIAHRVRIDADE